MFQARRGREAREEAWLDAAGSVDRSKLQTALDSGNIKVVTLLLARKHGASLASDPLEDGQLPLFVAIELFGRSCGPIARTVVDIVTLLLEKRAEANATHSALRESPLQMVIRMDALGASNELLELTHWACNKTVLTLLEHKADPNHMDMVGEGPLAEAAVAGNLEACVLLLSYGASPTMPNESGRRPLDLDIPDAARALLEGGEGPDAHETAGGLPLEDTVGIDGVDDNDTSWWVGLPWENDAAGHDSSRPAGDGRVEAEAGDEAIEDIDIDDDEAPVSGEEGAPASASTADTISDVQMLREKANKHFSMKQYSEAKEVYSEALQSQPDNAILWSNKAAACMMLGDYQQALDDATAGVKLDFWHARVHERCAKCMLLLGKLDQADKFCQLRKEYMQPKEFDNPSDGWRAFLNIASRVSDHSDAIGQIDEILGDARNSTCLADAEKCVSLTIEMIGSLGETERRSPWGKRIILTKIKALLFPLSGTSGQKREDRYSWVQQGLEEIERLVANESEEPNFHHWKGRCLLRQGRREQARACFSEALRIGGGKHQITEELLECMNISETERENGKQAFLQGEYKSAQEHYDIAVRSDRLRSDPEFSATLLCNRSTCLHKRGGQVSLCSALEDVNKALSLRPSYMKAMIRRGLVCMDQERYESARASFNDAAKLDPKFPGLADLQSRARRWAAHPPKRNYYAVLRVGFDASEAMIKKAYKAAALKWHPDKNPEENEEAGQMFKDIQEAFNVLSEPQLRREYDQLDDERRALKADGGSDSASDTQEYSSVTGPTYKPFFGASFGTAADFGHTNASGQPAAFSSQCLASSGRGTPAAAPGAVDDLRTGQFQQKMVKPINGKGGSNAYASTGSRFEGWTYKGKHNEGKGTMAAAMAPLNLSAPDDTTATP